MPNPYVETMNQNASEWFIEDENSAFRIVRDSESMVKFWKLRGAVGE